MQQQIHELDVDLLGQAYRRRQLDPVRVCEQLLARIDDARVNCNAFAHVDYAAALAAAQASSERWLDGRELGSLDGVPLAIKDVLDVAGMPTRYGSPACAEAPPAPQDCLLVQRLRAAGAVILGKTRTWEFAWRSNPERDPAEVVRNPHDPACSPGGSSTGSAAAVAAGLCPLAFGTDSGGSVRGPAAFCGIVGFKPSHALIPVYPPSPMGDLEHIGIFARSVADVRTALDQIGGSHSDDPASWPFRVPLAAPEVALDTLRLGCSVDLNYADPQPELRTHFAALVEHLRQSGCVIEVRDIPFRAEFEKCYDLYIPDAALTLELAPPERRHLVDPEIAKLARQGEQMNVVEYARLELLRAQLQRVFAREFVEIDCLLTLTQQTTANRLDQEPGIMKLTRCFNLTGQPAISIPCGTSAAGMPIGLQLVCERGSDGLLLAIAARIAAVLAEA
jgi:Asp-tRNA(Asn)/Glu-tRNA(Gln) amidotransferase A subunit family amidase